MKKLISATIAMALVVTTTAAGAAYDTTYTWIHGDEITLTQYPSDISFEENPNEFIFASAAVSVGLMSLDEDGNFRPDEQVSRAEAAAILDRLPLPYMVTSRIVYRDVPSACWYTEAVNNTGSLIGGTSYTPNSNDTEYMFYPNNKIEKEDFILGLFNRLNMSSADYWFDGFTGNVSDFASQYLDADDITRPRSGAWDAGADYIEAINWLVRDGIVAGEDGCFKPHSKVTRAQAAEMIMRTYDLYHLASYHPW